MHKIPQVDAVAMVLELFVENWDGELKRICLSEQWERERESWKEIVFRMDYVLNNIMMEQLLCNNKALAMDFHMLVTVF